MSKCEPLVAPFDKDWSKMSSKIESLIEQAYEQFDQMNAQDPTSIEVAGVAAPRELTLALWLFEWVNHLQPQASVALRLASRCQHLMRFSVPRSDYPEGRVGYLKWRKDLSKRHADLATKVLFELGFEPSVIEQVRKINLKQELTTDPDCQAMEDALCLSFLQHEYTEFSQKYDDDKVIDIVQKTWRKMSKEGQRHALSITLEGRAQALVLRALSS